jgi:hypothetical protein
MTMRNILIIAALWYFLVNKDENSSATDAVLSLKDRYRSPPRFNTGVEPPKLFNMNKPIVINPRGFNRTKNM